MTEIPPLDPAAAAQVAGLRYVSDAAPGLRRQRRGKGFRYLGTGGRVIDDPDTLSRIRRLAIPPAWRDVWICPSPDGHIQAVGRDARGRKQYRYHARWRKVRDATKYHKLIAFAGALPRVRARVAADLALPGLPRAKVLAAIVRLLETTHMRVGNEEYARTNASYGLTTLKDRHVRVDGATIRFRFRGKSGKVHEIAHTDARLARIVARCRDIPGQELFQYIDEDGAIQSVGSADVNDYLREAAGEELTAKDFRTWAGTVLAALELAALPSDVGARRAKRNLLAAIERVAARLGNTVTICRRCYVHPAVLDAWIDGSLAATLARAKRIEPAVVRVIAKHAPVFD